MLVLADEFQLTVCDFAQALCRLFEGITA